jgi:hypothetical protein
MRASLADDMPTDSGLARGNGSVAPAGSANNSAVNATHNERILMLVSSNSRRIFSIRSSMSSSGGCRFD